MIRTRRSAIHLKKRTHKRKNIFIIAVLSGVAVSVPMHNYIFSSHLAKLPAASVDVGAKNYLMLSHNKYADSLFAKSSRTNRHTSFSLTAYKKIADKNREIFIRNKVISYKKSISILQLAHIANILKVTKLNIFTGHTIGIIKASKGTSLQYTPLSGIWYKLRLCESGSNYSLNTGNGYYGAYQFAPSTWWAIGFTGMPNEASPEVQDEAAVVLQKVSGWIAWPQCASSLGLLG